MSHDAKLVCGSEWAFQECRFAGAGRMRCAAPRETHFGCEYHDNGDVARELRKLATLNTQSRETP